MRAAFGAVAVAALFGLTPAAHAVGDGRIDHVQPKADGTVEMLFSVPDLAGGFSPDLDSVKVSVGGTAVPASASPVEAGDMERTAVLAIDVSDSMAGERFAAAKSAALAYLDAAPADVSIGLVTFAGTVEVAAPPTTDHATLTAAIEQLELSRGTRLYDGTIEALSTAGGEGQRNVLLLSDGADTTNTPLTDVVKTAEQSGVTVNAVALEQTQADEALLRRITTATSGVVVPADDPEALTELLTREAEVLASQILIEFTPGESAAEEATVNVSIEADGELYRDSAFISLRGEAPAVAVDGPRAVDTTPLVTDPIFLYAGVASIGVGVAVVLAMLLMGGPKQEKSLIERQIEFYGAKGGGSTSRASLPQPSNVRDSAVKLADQVVQGGGFEEKLSQRLTGAGVAFTAAEWLLVHAGIAVSAALVGMLMSGPIVMVLLFGAGVVLPWFYLGFKRSRRLNAFNGQLAETLQLLSGGLSAGLSMPQAIDTVVREGTDPMAGEMRRALIEQRLGVEIEDALDGVADRMTSDDFRWVVMAIRIQREVGGNLGELLDTVAATLREREYLRRQVKVLSAEGRLSAWVIGALPVIFVLYLSLTRPGYLTPLYTEPIGLMMSGAAVVLLTMGTWVLRKMTNVEV